MMAINSIANRLQTFDGHQGGAVILLVFAAFLILTLASMIVFEAGESSQAKMQVQTAADSAAYSQSVVKARSMNMISYANTTKRMYYAYHHTYFAAFQALVTSTATYWGRCLSWLPHIPSCLRAPVGTAQIVAEGINFLVGVLSTISNTRDEIGHLDNYQQYLTEITPWWSFSEGLFRSTTNKAHISTSWPPPNGTVNQGMGYVNSAISMVNNLPGVSLPDASTGHTDSLPVERRDENTNTIQSHMEYCVEYILTPEQALAVYDHYDSSDGLPLGISTENQTLGYLALYTLTPLNLSCIASSFFLGSDVLDYRVDEGLISGNLDENDWMQSTSSMTFTYQNSGHSTFRENYYEHILKDHDEGLVAYESEGSWAMARSEIFWGPSPIAETMDSIPGFSNVGSVMGNIGSNALAGPAAAAAGGPHMWTPRWTARLRPMKLPGETITAGGAPVGLGEIYLDTLPYLGIVSLVQGILAEGFALDDAARDLIFMLGASNSFSEDNLEGLYR